MRGFHGISSYLYYEVLIGFFFLGKKSLIEEQ
jgi:hypothetical protein